MKAYIEIGFDGEPPEQQLESIRKVIDDTLKIIRVSGYELKAKVGERYYYSLTLKEDRILKRVRKIKVSPYLLLHVHVSELGERFKQRYPNVTYVGLGGNVEL